MKPAYKIEIYDNTPALRYTIEDTAFNMRTTKSLIDNVGTFTFSIPSDKPNDTMYLPNIALHDTAKFYFGYNAIAGAATPDFIGKICRIEGKPDLEGRIRVITGKDQGEIMQRRLKAEKFWHQETAHDITVDLADDIGLGTGDIAADATQEFHRVAANKHEPYLSLIQKASNYWKDAGTQVQKDFHVDQDFDLVWAARPFRTVGVETLTVGKNILNYAVVKDVSTVKNRIYVYGQKGKPNDSTLDFGTDMATPEDTRTTVDVQSNAGQKVLSVTATAGFAADDVIGYRRFLPNYTGDIERNVVASVQAGVSLTLVYNIGTYGVGSVDIPVGADVFKLPTWTELDANCTISAENGANDYLIGDRGIQVTAAGATENCMEYLPTTYVNLNQYTTMNFYAMSETDPNPIYIRLGMGIDHANEAVYYYTGTPLDNAGDIWKYYTIPVGGAGQLNWQTSIGHVYEKEWEYTSQIGFFAENVADGRLIIDGLYFGDGRYNATVDNVASQTSYGIREMTVTDESLRRDTQCEQRGEALLFQLKDPITRIDLETKGNTNILIGDQLTVTIPAEGISAASADVVEVSHYLSGDIFKTGASTINTSTSRQRPARTKDEALISYVKRLREWGISQ